jgi:S-adenosylmethionine:tRNA ribosyltransferase-isomerase
MAQGAQEVNPNEAVVRGPRPGPRFPVEYELPARLIAQEPCEPRDQARLLVLRRSGQTLEHRHFYEVPELLQAGDLLVLNDTRVVPARLLGRRARSGGKWEGLFLRALPDGCWEIMCQARGRLQEGETIEVAPGPLTLELTARLDGGRWRVRPSLAEEARELLRRFGQVPLPPYIRQGTARAEDRDRSPTVFARRDGAVAAPTAGLHFTPRLFERLRERSIGWAFVTLHVGPGTFQPIQSEDYTRHPMHHEWGELSAATAEAIGACKRRGGRIVAVGTTAVRVLETAAHRAPGQAWAGETDLFIHPPYAFRAIDALVTNFHMPHTTLLLLVAAFAGVEFTRTAYQAAVAAEYRFFSYGDATLIV